MHGWYGTHCIKVSGNIHKILCSIFYLVLSMQNLSESVHIYCSLASFWLITTEPVYKCLTQFVKMTCMAGTGSIIWCFLDENDRFCLVTLIATLHSCSSFRRKTCCVLLFHSLYFKSTKLLIYSWRNLPSAPPNWKLHVLKTAPATINKSHCQRIFIEFFYAFFTVMILWTDIILQILCVRFTILITSSECSLL